MKTLNITFTEQEYNRISKDKPDHVSWHDFLLIKCTKQKGAN